jgi:hypothetical protein
MVGSLSSEYNQGSRGFTEITVQGKTPTDAETAFVYFIIKGSGNRRGSGTFIADNANLQSITGTSL